VPHGEAGHFIAERNTASGDSLPLDGDDGGLSYNPGFDRGGEGGL